MATHGTAPTSRSLGDPDSAAPAGQLLTLVFGVVFVVVGIWGFLLTGVDGNWFAHHTGEEILGLFQVNPLHNTAHLLFGVAGIVAARRLRWSLAWNVVGAVAYGGLVVYGLFAEDADWDVLAINPADNWLHVGLTVGLAALAVACWAQLVSIRRAATIDLRDRTMPPPSTGSADLRVGGRPASDRPTTRPTGQSDRPVGSPTGPRRRR